LRGQTLHKFHHALDDPCRSEMRLGRCIVLANDATHAIGDDSTNRCAAEVNSGE
jgi:hypothetical protein